MDNMNFPNNNNNFKYNKYNNHNKNKYNNKKRPIIKFENLPQINSLDDLIKAGNNFKFYKNVDSIMIWRLTPYLSQLNKLIGMAQLKESLLYQILYYIQGMHLRNKENDYLHTIIMGAPGTGKTTVAYIIADIYKTIGILNVNAPFKIAHRNDFIAGYLGQTAIKTQTLLNSCLGGILFIDEVYSLSSGKKDTDSYSKEAIDTLCSFLSEHKSDFCCIAAGYEQDINECFFSINKGLKRRFPWIHKIDEYKSIELAQIFIKMVKDISWELDIDAKDISEIIEQNKNIFKYAGGDMENFLTKCKIVHSKRVISLNQKHKFILTKDDLNNAIEFIKDSTNDHHDNSPPPGMYC